MNNFSDIVAGIKQTTLEPKEYFNQSFSSKNYKNYHVDFELEANQKKAIKIMFTSKKDIQNRVDAALNADPFCLEAFFVYFILNEDVFVNYRFETYFNQAVNYADLDDYEQYCFLTIMDFYVEFLMEIHNIKKAIKVQKTMNKLSNPVDESIIHRMSLLYSLIEDSESFYRLYLDYEFTYYDYILLLVTLLKNDEHMLAKQVLDDMVKNTEYASFLDHLWDLDMEDPKQKDFYNLIEECYPDIMSVPNFFSWVNLNKESLDE